MIGPAFINAADSASPHGSITPGKARPITSSAWSALASGKTPTGSRLARMVIATSNGPCLRVSQGSVPVSAKLTVAGLPASRAAIAKIIEPNVAGGRNTTWPSVRCGASCFAMSACANAGAGHRINSASAIASAMSEVTSASCTSCRPLTSLTRMREPAARCSATCAASRRHSRTSWPCSAKSPAAAKEPLPPPSTAIRMDRSLFIVMAERDASSRQMSRHPRLPIRTQRRGSRQARA